MEFPTAEERPRGGEAPFLPLHGRTVLVTRPRDQRTHLHARLERLGATVLECPVIRVVGPADREPLMAAVRRLAEYQWVVFTSVNGVRGVEEELAAARAAGWPKATRVAAVGPATAAAVEARGWPVNLLPPTAVAEDLLAELKDTRLLHDARVLLPVAAGARGVLARGLRESGAVVDQVEAYRTVAAEFDGEALAAELHAGRIDALTFTSPSAVESFVAAVGTEVGSACVAVIGPITAATAQALGLRVDAEAAQHTSEGLVDALLTRIGRHPDNG